LTSHTLKAALSAHSSNHLAQALDLYEQALQEAPGNVLIKGGLGSLLAQMGIQGDRAQSLLSQAVKKAPEEVVFKVNLGALLLERQQPGPALFHLESALSCCPQAPLEWKINLVRAYQVFHSLKKKSGVLETCCERAPEIV
jgi:predicted Zn-dependent protease